MRYISTFFKVCLAAFVGLMIFQIIPALISADNWTLFGVGILLCLVFVTVILVIIVDLFGVSKK